MQNTDKNNNIQIDGKHSKASIDVCVLTQQIYKSRHKSRQNKTRQDKRRQDKTTQIRIQLHLVLSRMHLSPLALYLCKL